MFVAILKALLFGIVEGVTEWLPVSSTGHIILLDAMVPLGGSPAFYDLFEILVQLGAIMAVVVLYFRRLNPLTDKSSLSLWGKVLVGVIPSAAVGFFLDEPLDAFLRQTPVKSTSLNVVVVAGALILYGIGFIVLESVKGRIAPVDSLDKLSYKHAFGIGAFQMLALIPGTSRSGSTILGASLLGTSRTVAAEFSFFMAIPVMLGASGLKFVKALVLDGVTFTADEWVLLAVATAVSFVVSLLVIRGLMAFIKKYSFKPFGWYRIALGAVVLLCVAMNWM